MWAYNLKDWDVTISQKLPQCYFVSSIDQRIENGNELQGTLVGFLQPALTPHAEASVNILQIGEQHRIALHGLPTLVQDAKLHDSRSIVQVMQDFT